MARSKRRTSARIKSAQKRKPVEVEEPELKITEGINWYMQQSPNSKVYYLKLLFGIVSGTVVGLFYGISIVAQNWFIFPMVGVGVIGLVARRYLLIDKDTITDLKLYAWNGTISLFICFIVSSSFIFMLFNPSFVAVTFPS